MRHERLWLSHLKAETELAEEVDRFRLICQTGPSGYTRRGGENEL